MRGNGGLGFAFATAPIHCPEAEIAVLGAMIVYPEARVRIGVLDPEAFLDLRNRRAFSAVRARIDAGEHVDPITLKATFAGDPDLGAAFLAELVGHATTPINASEYAVELRRLRRLRDLDFLADDIRTFVRQAEPGEDPAAYLAQKVAELPERVDSAARLQCLSEIRPGNVPWLWQGRFVLDGPNIIAGLPDVGKNVFLSDVIARVTTGREWPDGTPNEGAGRALIAETEDAYDHTVVPRLIAAGADISKCFRVLPKGVPQPSDLAGFRIFVPSPVISLMDIRKNSNSEQDVRELLVAWTESCRENSCALLAPAHFNKKADLAALQRILGSGAFAGFPRSVWCITRDDEDATIRLLLKLKANLAPDETSGLRFAIRHTGGEWDQSIACHWMGTTDKNADEVMQARHAEASGKKTASKWLLEYLQAHGGMAAANVIIEAGEKAGYGRESLIKARQRNPNIVTFKSGMSDGWWWQLSDLADASEADACH